LRAIRIIGRWGGIAAVALIAFLGVFIAVAGVPAPDHARPEALAAAVEATTPVCPSAPPH
jgi:hypothetical protein